LKELEQ
jgi:hypothetical protein